MKQLTLFFIYLFFQSVAFAQYPGNANDWVEYGTTYYKFSISEDGIYRLNKSDLINVGIPESEIIGSDFKLVRNGEELPLYVTTDGEFGDSDYLEFFGRMNRADVDKVLYSSPLQQPGESQSLFTDQSIHFLSVIPNQQHLRITDLQNNLNDLPAKEEYYFSTIISTSTGYRQGRFTRIGGTSLYASSFDNAEGFNIRMNAGQTRTFNFNADHIVQTSGDDVKVNFKTATLLLNSIPVPSSLEVYIGNSERFVHPTDGQFAYQAFQQKFNTGNLSNSRFRIINHSPNRIFVPELSLEYPRAFVFNDRNFDKIEIRKSGSRYLELENLPGTEIILYDVSSNERIVESVSTVTQIRTGENSISNELIFDTDIQTPQFTESVSFSDPLSGNFDFIVITHPALESPVNGEDYIEKYISFKQTEVGGEWTIKKVYIQDLIDQFAYGIEGHSAAIKNYVQELKEVNKIPTHILLIGKGYEYDLTRTTSYVDDYIPVYGTPGSDSQHVTDYQSEVMLTSIGRISARNSQELKYYVDKIIHYQNLIADTSDPVQTKEKLWMKQGMNLGGGIDASQQNSFKSILDGLALDFAEPFMGGVTTSFFKDSTDPIQDVDIPSIDSLMNNGLSLINYFGHSAISALEFNINDFSQFQQDGKYPFMLTNGCFVGDLFQERKSLSEDFILSDNSGTMSFMGPSQFGISTGMTRFCRNFYEAFIEEDYGISIGEAIVKSHNTNPLNGWVDQLTKQQMIFHGDPSLPIYPHEKPDYLIEEDDIQFEPNNITADVEEFTVYATISNIGKAIEEPVTVRLTRTLPNGEQEVYEQVVENILYQKVVPFTIETNILFSEGVNEFQVEIDAINDLDEITRANNNLSAPVTRAIISDSVNPILPNEFGITDDSDVELIAHASVYTTTERNFIFQIDTTELFNSSLLENGTLSSLGGTLRWNPQITLENETVYYWRVKEDSQDSDWSNSSFIYLQEYEEGWNQSHYYQFLKDDYTNLSLEQEFFEFGENIRTVNVRTAMVPTLNAFQIAYSLDGVALGRRSCNRDIMIAIFDENTGIHEVNQNPSQDGITGLYGSKFCNNSSGINAFHYDVATPEDRKALMDFFELIEDGKYILLFSIDPLEPVANNWAGDQDLYGQTLIDVLNQNGATLADQIGEETPYVFFFQKGNSNFSGTQDFVGVDNQSIIDEFLDLPVSFAEGVIESTLIGPASSWGQLEWSWDSSFDNIPDGDNMSIDIIGITSDDEEVILYQNITDLSFDLSSIDASVYANIKLRVNVEDKVTFTAPQLQTIRIIYETLPEMALNVVDVIGSYPLEYSQNQPVTVIYQLENLHTKDMQPVLVNYLYNQAQGGQILVDERYDELPAGTTQSVEYSLLTGNAQLVGDNLLFIDANPNDDQPEQYHFNNIALIEFQVEKDNENPFLDVTFDGIHIIDGDLVADTPEIIITVTDENEYLPLNDPDGFEIFVTFPDQSTPLQFDSSSPEITFYPADGSADNQAIIEFRPEFIPGIYEMRVQAKDRSNNVAGENDYLVTFEVTNEDVITQVINYPNPFTTSTEFIAKIVGEIPDEILIQIFTPSGQVVRELYSTPADIGISQGNNFYTIAKWDGTDTFGDPLGNGVYYYKITMKRGGEIIDAYDSNRYSDYFHDGIGKLYIVR